MNGYFCRFEVHSSQKGSNIEKGLATRVVKNFTTDFKRKHHHVFFDNFFTSFRLMQDLKRLEYMLVVERQKTDKDFPTSCRIHSWKIDLLYLYSRMSKTSTCKKYNHTYVHSPHTKTNILYNTHTHTHTFNCILQRWITDSANGRRWHLIMNRS